MEAAILIVSEVLKMAFPPIKRGFGYVKRPFGYVISSQRYADNLRKKVRDLDCELQRVRRAEEVARNNHRDEWVPVLLASAGQASDEAKELLDEFDRASKTCCRGTIPDLKCRYQFSRRAKRKTDDIQKLICPVQCAADLLQEVRDLDREVQKVRNAAEEARTIHHDIHPWVPGFLASAEEASEEAKELLGRFEAKIKSCCNGTLPDPNCCSQFTEEAKSKTDDIKKLIVNNKDEVISFKGPAAYAADLRKEIRNLDREVERVGFLVTEARNNVRNFHDGFTRWEANAEEALREARGLLGDLEGASKTGCHGTLPVSCGRLMEVVRDLAQQCSNHFKGLNDVSFIPAPGNVVTASTSIKPGEDGLFESRALMIRKVMDALSNTSNSVVGIYGMAGVGKSTLLVDIEKRIRKDRSFDWVAKADVSENPDIKRIQGEIAHCLGLSELEKKENVSLRAELLHKRLEEETKEENDEAEGLEDETKEENDEAEGLEDEGRTKEENDEERKKKKKKSKKKVLIILDNLWVPLDLKSVGIPCGLDNKPIGCKLLLTSRYENVLRREMRCDSDSAFPLKELEKEEAKRLFEKMVGGKVEVELEPLVEKALHICAGLPFLIRQIATLFIHTSYSECDDALKHIWHEKTGVVITNMLQLSYGRISDEEKSLLRLCVAYGVSKPSLEYLARYGFGLGIFRGVSSVQGARDKLPRLIRTLQASSLLLDDDKDADGFKIHDLVREFVASFASTDRPLLVLKDKDKSVPELSEDKLKSCEAMCFPYVDLEELPEELVCPELRIFLLLKYNNKSLKISDSYFNSMKNLMTLHLTGIRLTNSPSPFQFLEKLHTLCLDSCSLEDVVILGELKGLQILSFQRSDIQRLPKEIGQLTELRLLDLDHCSQLHTIEPGLLGKLTKLEELYMRYSFDKWDAVELTPATNASLIELNNMKKLHTLYVSIPDSSALPKDLDVEKLTKYKIQIGNVWRWSKYEGSRTLELKLDPASDVLQKECIRSMLGKIDDLFLDGMDGSEQSICTLSQKGFPQLKHLQVENSPSIHCILESSSHAVFETLESLLLKNIINLEKITNNNISSSKSFSTLKVVRVQSCDKMEVLFPRSVARELPQLEEINVKRCKLMRAILEADDDHGKLEFPKLCVLELGDLPNIENFIIAGSAPLSSTSDGQVGTQIAFFDGQQVAFPRLATLEIDRLDNVRFMFSPSTVRSLTQLRELKVSSSEKMEAIIIEEEGFGIETSRTLEFSMLTDLSLVGLGSLMCFSLEKCLQEGRRQDHIQLHFRALFNRTVAFPRLKKLKIDGLDNLRFTFFPSMVKSLALLEKLHVSNCEKMEAIIMEDEGSGVEISEIPVFPMLTDLSLTKLGSLTCFSPKKLTGSREGWSQDKVQLHSNALFNREGAFPNLQKLKLDLSERVEIWHGNFHDEESFCELRVLELRHLPKEYAMSTCCFVESLTNLEELVVCESYLEERSSDVEAMEGPSHEQKVILPFSRQIKLLKTLDVSHCDGLSSMFTPTIAENLVALTKLRISNCRILAEVLHDEEGEERREVAFSQLKYMELDGLIELRCFSSGGQALRFPLLEDVIVNGCPHMEVFSKGR